MSKDDYLDSYEDRGFYQKHQFANVEAAVYAIFEQIYKSKHIDQEVIDMAFYYLADKDIGPSFSEMIECSVMDMIYTTNKDEVVKWS